MGADGGTVPTRAELVKTKKKLKKDDPKFVNEGKWTRCSLTQEPLCEPVVVCELGNLYNKEAVIQKHLLAEHKLPAFSHIRRLKDVREAKVKFSERKTESGCPFLSCPVTGVDANNKHRFVVTRDCGCVVSEKALKEIGGEVCVVCGSKCTGSPTVLYPPMEELDAIREELIIRIKASSKKVCWCFMGRKCHL